MTGASPPTLWTFDVYFGLVVAAALGMLAVSFVLGQRHKEPSTGTPYESGIVPTGSARLRLSVKFYLVAIFFVVFDVEAVFVIVWAVAIREVGWAGYFEILIFIGILFAGLVYLWKEGALDWGSVRRIKRARS